MGHNITAIITQNPIAEQEAREYKLPFVYEKGFCIIFLEALHTDYWTSKIAETRQINLKDESEHELPILLDGKFTYFIAQELGIKTFALIETDYFGGAGTQWACVYEDGKQIMPYTEGGINQALQKIAVSAKEGLDEFDTLNLSKYRDYEDALKAAFPDNSEAEYKRWWAYWE